MSVLDTVVASQPTEMSIPPSSPATPPPAETPSTTPRRQFLSPLAAMLRAKYASPLQHSVTAESVSNGSMSPPGPSSAGTDPSEAGSQDSLESTIAGEEDEDDARTERGVKMDPGDDDTPDTPTPKASIKAESEGYGLTGSVFSSLFWRTPGKREVEKDVTTPTPLPSTPVPSIINT